MEDLIEVEHIDQISTNLAGGHYWDFPEVIFSWGKALHGARLLRLDGPGFTWYLRAQRTTATLASWQGEHSLEALVGGRARLAAEGLRTLHFQPHVENLKTLLPGGYNVPTWYTLQSWRDMPMSQNRRWQFRRAAGAYKFTTVGQADMEEARRVIDIWVERARPRHTGPGLMRLSGVGHYYSMLDLHPTLPRSELWLARRRDTGQAAGLVGGYVRKPYSVVVNMKHDYSDKWLAHALWGFWIDYVHGGLGVELNCSGSTSDDIKRRMRMELRQHYKPPKIVL